MSIPDDIARCHDASCGSREHCRRWLERDEGGAHAVHAGTLRYGWEFQGEPCHAVIPADDGAQ